jgi:hypothetical protein
MHSCTAAILLLFSPHLTYLSPNEIAQPIPIGNH